MRISLFQSSRQQITLKYHVVYDEPIKNCPNLWVPSPRGALPPLGWPTVRCSLGLLFFFLPLFVLRYFFLILLCNRKILFLGDVAKC
jgi:hypothetical protein